MRKLLAVAFLFLSTTTLHAAVTGVVLDEEGAPVGGARVRALRQESSEEFWTRALSDSPDPVAVATAKSGDDGSFSLEIKPQQFVVVVADQGSRVATIFASDGDRRTLVFPSKSWRGRVMANGKPVAGARVVAGRNFVLFTAADGTYEIPEGMVRDGGEIVILAPGFAPGSIPRGRRATVRNLADVVLQKGASLRGQVVAADGKTPVPDATLEWNAMPIGKSSADGTFVIANMPSQWKTLFARERNRVASVSRAKQDSYLLKLRPAASIAGRLRNAVDDKPLPNAVVLVNNAAFDVGRWLVTDGKGSFQATGLTAGTWRLVPVRAAFPFRPLEVRVTEGERVERTIAIRPMPVMAGRVVDEEKKPVGTVEIESAWEKAFTNPDGTFEIPVPGDGRNATITLRKRGFALTTAGPYAIEPGQTKTGLQVVLTRGVPVRVQVVDGSGNGVPAANVTVSIADSGESRFNDTILCRDCPTDDKGVLEISLAPGPREFAVSGDRIVARRVRHEVSRGAPAVTIRVEAGALIQGRVVAADGNTVLPEDLMVAVKGAPFGTGGVRIGEDGSFKISDAPAGRLTLVVQKLSEGTMATGPELEVTAPATGVILTAPKLGRIEGRVVDRASKQPIREFTVRLRRNRGSGGSSGSPRTMQSEDGIFVLDAIPSGIVDVMVTAPGYATAVLSNVNGDDTREPLEVQLERGGSVAGRVTRKGRGVAEAYVSLAGNRGPGGPSATTDSEGEFILDGLAAGEYTIQVFRRGSPNVRKTVEVATGREERVQIEIPEGASVAGRVLDEYGQPVGRARIYTRGMGGTSTSTDSDADGAFTLEGITEDSTVLVAEKSGYLQATVEDFNAKAGSGVTLTLRRGGTVRGQVRGLTEQEMASVRVDAFGRGTRTSARPDASGQFTLTGVPEGQVAIRANLEGESERSAHAAVEVANGTAPAVDLDFAAGFPVRGRVTRAGAPMRLVAVMFQPVKRGANMRQARGEANADGVYEVRIPEPGEYRVIVESGAMAGLVEAGTVTFSGPVTHDIALEGSPLRGRVVDAAGQPIASVLVAATRVGASRGPLSATSDADGRFSFEVVPPGKYMMRTTKQRYASEVQELEVRESGMPDVELRMREGDRAVLRIVDAATRKPVERAAITIVDGAKRTLHTGDAFREDDGAFRVWLAPGQYVARIWSPGYIQATANVTVPGPETQIAMSRGGRIVLQGTKPGAVRGFLIDATTGRKSMQTPIPPGVWDGVAPGSYRVELYDGANKVIDSFPVEVVSGQTSVVKVD